MGSLLNRSFIQGDETKRKIRKDKRKRQHQQLDILYPSNIYSMEDDNNYEELNRNLVNTYELWSKKFSQQHLMNMSDSLDTPSTDSSNYSNTHNDIIIQPWSSFHNPNNSFHPLNSRGMILTTNISYDPRQHIHAQIPNAVYKQPNRSILEKQLSQDVQFLSSHQERKQQSQTSTLKSLTNTQSWHPSISATSDISAPTPIKLLPLSNRSNVTQSTAVIPNTISTKKAVYVTIDHKATLAERGQTIANKRHRQNGERNHSEGLNSSTNNHRIHSHTEHKHKHKKPTISSTSNVNVSPSKSLDSLPPKLSNSQRTITKAISTNKLTQNIEQMSFINNETKPLKNGENHRRHRRQHRPNEPPLHTESSSRRRIENKNSNKPMMKIALSQKNQQHQKQINTPSIIQTRV